MFRMLKRNARLALRGSWGRAIVLLLILSGVVVAITALQQIAMTVFVVNPIISNPTMEPPANQWEALTVAFKFTPVEWIIIAVVSVLSLLLVSPLQLGIARWYYRLVHGERLPVSDMFHFFESGSLYGRAIWYDINMTVRCFLWAIPFYLIPSGILGVSVYFLSGTDELARSAKAIASTGVFLSCVLFLLASVFYTACICRYALAPFLLGENDDTAACAAIKSSAGYSKGFRFSLMWFSFSFIGWFLLMIFLLPGLYVIPYYNTSIAMYARYIIEKNRQAPLDAPEATREFHVSDGEETVQREPTVPDAEETWQSDAE